MRVQLIVLPPGYQNVPICVNSNFERLKIPDKRIHNGFIHTGKLVPQNVVDPGVVVVDVVHGSVDSLAHDTLDLPAFDLFLCQKFLRQIRTGLRVVVFQIPTHDIACEVCLGQILGFDQRLLLCIRIGRSSCVQNVHDKPGAEVPVLGVVRNAKEDLHQTDHVKRELVLILNKVVQSFLHGNQFFFRYRNHVHGIGNIPRGEELVVDVLLLKTIGKGFSFDPFVPERVHVRQRRIEADRGMRVQISRSLLDDRRNHAARMHYNDIHRVELLVGFQRPVGEMLAGCRNVPVEQNAF